MITSYWNKDELLGKCSNFYIPYDLKPPLEPRGYPIRIL